MDISQGQPAIDVYQKSHRCVSDRGKPLRRSLDILIEKGFSLNITGVCCAAAPKKEKRPLLWQYYTKTNYPL